MMHAFEVSSSYRDIQAECSSTRFLERRLVDLLEHHGLAMARGVMTDSPGDLRRDAPRQGSVSGRAPRVQIDDLVRIGCSSELRCAGIGASTPRLAGAQDPIDRRSGARWDHEATGHDERRCELRSDSRNARHWRSATRVTRRDTTQHSIRTAAPKPRLRNLEFPPSQKISTFVFAVRIHLVYKGKTKGGE